MPYTFGEINILSGVLISEKFKKAYGCSYEHAQVKYTSTYSIGTTYVNTQGQYCTYVCTVSESCQYDYISGQEFDCTGVTFCPCCLISCVLLAQNRRPHPPPPSHSIYNLLLYGLGHPKTT